jgi:hypothetical protein
MFEKLYALATASAPTSSPIPAANWVGMIVVSIFAILPQDED